MLSLMSAFGIFAIPKTLLIFRAIAAAADADAPAQFNLVVSAVNVVSENQAQLGHEVKAMKNKDRLRDCKDHEEKEGRMNCDMLNRFIVIGGPYIDPGLNQQSALQAQVALFPLTCFYTVATTSTAGWPILLLFMY